MLVKATRLGYYGERRRKEGSVFKLVDKKYFVYEDMKNEKGKPIRDKRGKKKKKKIPHILKAENQFSEEWMMLVEEEEVAKEDLDHADAEVEAAELESAERDESVI